jgi:hypothetical protein
LPPSGFEPQQPSGQTFLLLVSRAFLERHMEGGKKIKIKLYFPTSQKCLHHIFRAEDGEFSEQGTGNAPK